jgi:ubiquinone/menaquinone biosynthesis C-methylase UbiE
MKQLTFTRPPVSFDRYGQPRFLLNQTKGLSESQSNQLIESALQDGYTSKVAHSLKTWVLDQIVSASSGKRVDVLEIGGGAGDFFESVKDRVSSYVNVEPGEIELSHRDVERLGDSHFVTLKCSAEEIPLADSSVDVIVSIASLDHVPDYRRALHEASRLLRKDGVFILTLNNRRSWWKVLLSGSEYLKAREQEIAREHYFQWSFDECQTNVCRHLELKTAGTMTFVPFVPKLGRLLLPPTDFVGRRLLPRGGANILMVCQKSPSQP